MAEYAAEMEKQEAKRQAQLEALKAWQVGGLGGGVVELAPRRVTPR